MKNADVIMSKNLFWNFRKQNHLPTKFEECRMARTKVRQGDERPEDPWHVLKRRRQITTFLQW